MCKKRHGAEKKTKSQDLCKGKSAAELQRNKRIRKIVLCGSLKTLNSVLPGLELLLVQNLMKTPVIQLELKSVMFLATAIPIIMIITVGILFALEVRD